MSASTNSMVPPRYLANTALALGLFITGNNIYGAINPRGALQLLGFPLPATLSDQNLAEGLTRMFATTRVVCGISSVALWYYNDYKVLGIVNIVGCLMAISDGFVSRKVIGKGEWGHWGAIPIGLGIGAGLFLAE